MLSIRVAKPSIHPPSSIWQSCFGIFPVCFKGQNAKPSSAYVCIMHLVFSCIAMLDALRNPAEPARLTFVRQSFVIGGYLDLSYAKFVISSRGVLSQIAVYLSQNSCRETRQTVHRSFTTLSSGSANMYCPSTRRSLFHTLFSQRHSVVLPNDAQNLPV